METAVNTGTSNTKPKPDVSSCTIAIADDHFELREALTGLLTTLGYDVVISAENGKELLEHIEKAEQLPDICIVDVVMPVMDGYETAKELKKRWPAIKVLAFSFRKEKWAGKGMVRKGADVYLQKDAHPQILHATLQILYKSILSNRAEIS